MNSHEFARELQKTVDHLLSRPEFESDSAPHLFMSFWEKDKFVTAARAVGAGKKEFTAYGDFHFSPNDTCLTLSIVREKVCRKVQDAKWECEPLFTSQEIENVEIIEEVQPTSNDIPF